MKESDYQKVQGYWPESRFKVLVCWRRIHLRVMILCKLVAKIKEIVGCFQCFQLPDLFNVLMYPIYIENKPTPKPTRVKFLAEPMPEEVTQGQGNLLEYLKKVAPICLEREPITLGPRHKTHYLTPTSNFTDP